MTNKRQILLHVTLPTVGIGILLLVACLLAVRSLHRLQSDHSRLLAKSVRSLQVLQEMEIRLRQLRFHSLLHLLEPTDARHKLVVEDQQLFERAFEQVSRLSTRPEEIQLVRKIKLGYTRYRDELERDLALTAAQNARRDLLRWVDSHPIRHLVAPCQELLRVHEEFMDAATHRSEEAVSEGTRMLLILGVLGPISGLLSGFGIAWGISRSITKLHVWLQDVSANLDRELGTVKLTGEGDASLLDQLLRQVGDRVGTMIGRLQLQDKEMLRAEQLAAVGQLAAGIAHEVRNPLTSIKLLVGSALKTRPMRPLSEEDLQVIYGVTSKLESKVQALLDYARPAEIDRRPCDVRDLIHDALRLVDARREQVGVRADVALPETPVLANVDRDQVTSVLVNLLLNALDAMAGGGQLAITLRPQAGGGFVLTVEDSGPGIEPSVLPRLFAPFTSTKKTGTGLGLSICQRTVQQHGGTITGENRLEGGARFVIVLPSLSQETRHADATCRG